MDLKLIYDELLMVYGPQGWWPLNLKYSGKNILNSHESFEISLGAILTQNNYFGY